MVYWPDRFRYKVCLAIVFIILTTKVNAYCLHMRINVVVMIWSRLTGNMNQFTGTESQSQHQHNIFSFIDNQQLVLKSFEFNTSH